MEIPEQLIKKYRWWAVGTNRGEVGVGQGPYEYFVTLKFDMGGAANYQTFVGWGRSFDEALSEAEKIVPSWILKRTGSLVKEQPNESR